MQTKKFQISLYLQSDHSLLCLPIYSVVSNNIALGKNGYQKNNFYFFAKTYIVGIIALDKVLFSTKQYLYFFLFFNTNIFCGYSLEAPLRGTFNEYTQHMFSLRNKKTINLKLLTHIIHFHEELRKIPDFLFEKKKKKKKKKKNFIEVYVAPAY